MKKPKFMESLRAILDDPANYDLIRWINVDKFIVLDPEAFSTTVIPKYFKHASFSSFIRQLHSYGFHKQTYANGSVEFTRDASMNGEMETAERKKTPAQYQIEQLRQQVDDLKQQNFSLQEANEKLQFQLIHQGGVKKEPTTMMTSSTTSSTSTSDLILPTYMPPMFQQPSSTGLTSAVESVVSYDDWWLPADQSQQQQQQQYSMMMPMASELPSPMQLPMLTRMPSLEEGKLRGQLSSEDVDMTINDMLMDYFLLLGF
jgi:hypothetical protein